MFPDIDYIFLFSIYIVRFNNKRFEQSIKI